MVHNPRTLHVFVGPNVLFCYMRMLYNAQIRVHTHPGKLIKHPKSSLLPGAMTKAVITGIQRCSTTKELLSTLWVELTSLWANILHPSLSYTLPSLCQSMLHPPLQWDQQLQMSVWVKTGSSCLSVPGWFDLTQWSPVISISYHIKWYYVILFMAE